LVDFADVIWLCVKSQNLAEVLGQLKTVNLKNKNIAKLFSQVIGSAQKSWENN